MRLQGSSAFETVVTVLYPLSFPFVILMVFTAPIRAAFDN
jgi:hypothetical protein